MHFTSHMHTHMHTYTHTCTQTCTHVHTHTHTHAHQHADWIVKSTLARVSYTPTRTYTPTRRHTTHTHTHTETQHTHTHLAHNRRGRVTYDAFDPAVRADGSPAQALVYSATEWYVVIARVVFPCRSLSLFSPPSSVFPTLCMGISTSFVVIIHIHTVCVCVCVCVCVFVCLCVVLCRRWFDW